MKLLFLILQTNAMSEGAKRMAETDPHGFTLALIAVSVVFSALLVLYFAFSLVGKISTRLDAPKNAPSPKKAPKQNTPDAEVAAAIALALEAEAGGEIPVAICTALALHLGHGIHDSEPGIITIKRSPSAWDSPALRFRKNPTK